MLWKECMPAEFYKFICKQGNFSFLNGKHVLHPRVADIVWRYICDGEANYKNPRETYSHGAVSVSFLSALNLFMGGDIQMSKNVLSELYYNLTLQVLSEEHTEHTAKFHDTDDLTAEINFKIQKVIRCNKLKREEDKQNYKNITDEMYNFKEEKTL